ncbi:velvet factor-domain-containing protein [Thamnidium elegans]|uniref:Velvet domain-containing protein n=1 Tax=Thamnidium elegans TaxID=101142 RepID=A0A8H7VZQ1_9FUNG|nr:hypothetical protein INT48_005853 [Thamnidium elegans]KAI8077074.1 velvet factor-domain-containing protein [Thamnidium elegans]
MFNNSDTNNDNYIFTRPPPPPPPLQQQQNVLISDPNVLLSSFEPSQPPLASSAGHSGLKPKPRQEQDVFYELISLATKNNSNRQDMGSWQSLVNTSTAQYAPSFFTNHVQEFDIQPPQSRLLQNNNPEYYQSLSKDSASLAKAAASKALAGSSNATKVPVTENNQSIITPHGNERIYELKIAQQPSRARMCGFGDKDRRPISPPPIVQLIITTDSGQIVNPETFDVSFLVAMCDSWQQNELENDDGNITNHANHLSQVISFPTTTLDEEGVETNSAIKMRNLVGSSVSSATKLYDLNGNLGIYFVFQDVSLRTEGCFRLKFSLVDVGSPYARSVNTSSNSHVLKAIYTDPFTVFTAKKFPGVVQSTPLSKCFARQGIKIPIRKEKLNPSKSKKKQADREFSEGDFDNE